MTEEAFRRVLHDALHVPLKRPATYWNGAEFTPYPPEVVEVAMAIWAAFNDVLDRHVRPTTWEDCQDGRSGTFAAAVAAIKVLRPGWELERKSK